MFVDSEPDSTRVDPSQRNTSATLLKHKRMLRGLKCLVLEAVRKSRVGTCSAKSTCEIVERVRCAAVTD